MSRVIDMGDWLAGRIRSGRPPPILRRRTRPNLEAAMRALVAAGSSPLAVKSVATSLDRAHVGPDRTLSEWLRDFEATAAAPGAKG